MNNKTIILFFISIFSCALSWLIVVPLWHTPDEQAHFGEVAFLAEKGRLPGGDDANDLTEEIYISEVLLGTVRDKSGNNKFTFHPEYRIEYTDSLVGKYEASIAALTKTSAKFNFIKNEAARYPTLYYYPASLFYRLFYNSDLITRVFTVRFWSLSLFLLNIFTIYQIGKLIIKDEKNSVILAALAGFQPMMVFANIGVNSDALGNLFFSIFLYFSIRLIIHGINILNVIFILAISILTIIAKPQFIIIFPIFIGSLLLLFVRNIIKKRNRTIIFICIILGTCLFYLLYKNWLGSFWLVSPFIKSFNFSSFLKYSLEYTIPHTYREVMPWYWGIYNWLGVTYPRFVHRIINWIVLISLVGFIFWLVKVIKNKLWRQREIQCVIFLISTALLFFFSISLYDWYSWYTGNYPLGVQGRYFFPLISIQMLIVFLGLESLLPEGWQKKISLTSLSVLMMMLLNLYALYTVSASYYKLLPISGFINQVSQYKPWFIKGSVIPFVFGVYFVSLIIFLNHLTRKTKELE